ncbi:MAG TPA: dihydroorotate dehydrogenase-like protein [Candidatus Saccharimonadales bacterium]|nr:dihydroorotate dehydrogenase-like protein [Candidatus Saccharimonadales bacterium]
MDLSTTYLKFRLPHPIMPGASPLVDDLDTVKRLEDAGAAAIVMHSLFEEQIKKEEIGTLFAMEEHAESFPEATSYFPDPIAFKLGPDQYLEQIRKIKRAVDVPVIGSLNGATLGGWLRYAQLIEEAGADALELNVYFLATEPSESAEKIERRILEMLTAIKKNIGIPVAVKLSPFFSSLSNLATRMDEAGADGLVLFNRFYQPDIDPELLEVVPTLRLSDPSELLLRLRWLAILSGRIWASLAASGGVHSGLDAIKAVMAGAHGIQVVSAILRHGPERLVRIRREMEQWLEEHEYDSLEQARGSMRTQNAPDPAAFERANYMKILQGWRSDGLHEIPIKDPGEI